MISIFGLSLVLVFFTSFYLKKNKYSNEGNGKANANTNHTDLCEMIHQQLIEYMDFLR